MGEFKKFILKGNVIDLAVAVIIGGAFGKIITSLVNDIIMPVAGLFTGGTDLSNLYYNLSDTKFESLAEAQAAGAATINYGLFINNIIDFLIIGFCIFIVIKQFERFKKPEPVPAEDTKKCPYCTSTIALGASRCPHCTSELGPE
ncbi:large-conductance mechanosensitive channel [hydrocarbon metagenome]|uniref:Large-conductance mechanosensitive channel n=1 Tax=hydrocarbon metagenome TaxID=938273 RepID=A0A0W8E4F0_9ZZZZ